MMKKYLMTGMAAATLCLAFTSCSKTDVYDPDAPGRQVTATYEQKFIEAIGQPSPAQDWGFGTAVAQARANTRYSNPEANMWAGQGWVVPKPLTEAQKDKVRRYFQQHKTPASTPIDYTDFFVQDVYKGGTNLAGSQTTEKYKAANGDEFFGSNKMDKLTAGSGNDHINNYNNSQCSPNNNVWSGELTNPSDPNSKVFHTDKIMLMVSSKTDCFGFTNSLQSGSQYNKNYVIVPGSVIQAWDSTGGSDANVDNMYFVGFDYDANFQNGWKDLYQSNSYLITEVPAGTEGAFQVPNKNDGKWYIDGAADGYYSDWVVRIIPGKGDPTPEPEPEPLPGVVRIIGEDLSATQATDFDFNDIVMDVTLTATGANIVLQAAGGTLPLRIAENDDNEVHKLFGVDTGTMVNTKAETKNLKGATKAPVSFSITGSFASAKDIKIEVKKNGQWVEMKAEQGEPAAKIAVNTTFQWCDELVSIKGEYPLFTSWVTSNHPGTVIWY